MKIIDNKNVEMRLKKSLKIKFKKITGNIVIIKTKDTKGCTFYINSILRLALELNIKVEVLDFTSFNEAEVVSAIERLNKDDKVDGILVTLPLNFGLDEDIILNKIAKEKDIDCLTNKNLSLIDSDDYEILPSVVLGISQVLSKNNISIYSKKIVILNNKKHLGKPLSFVFNQTKAISVCCDTKTENIKDIIKTADILIIATKKKYSLIDNELKKGVILIDINEEKNDYSNFKNIDTLITSVGSITTIMLFYNLYKLKKR